VKSSYQIVTVFGIPVRLDLSLLILLGLVWYGSFHLCKNMLVAMLDGTTWTLLLLLSISLHELGHCLLAVRHGCTVRGITLTMLGGRAELTHMPAQPLAEFTLAVAGPLVSLALWQGGVHGAAYFSSLAPTPATAWATDALQALAYLNVRLFWFNLVPAFPMDGGRILRALLAHRLGRWHATRIAVNIGRLLTVLTLLWLLTGPAELNIGYHAGTIAGWHYAFGPIHQDFNRLILGLIAVFILFAAEQEYRLIRLETEFARQGQRAPWLPPVPLEEQIKVSQPPQHRGAIDFRADHEKPRWWQWWQ
jgi:Zn-dependent protease